MTFGWHKHLYLQREDLRIKSIPKTDTDKMIIISSNMTEPLPKNIKYLAPLCHNSTLYKINVSKLLAHIIDHFYPFHTVQHIAMIRNY